MSWIRKAIATWLRDMAQQLDPLPPAPPQKPPPVSQWSGRDLDAWAVRYHPRMEWRLVPVQTSEPRKDRILEGLRYIRERYGTPRV